MARALLEAHKTLDELTRPAVPTNPGDNFPARAGRGRPAGSV